MIGLRSPTGDARYRTVLVPPPNSSTLALSITEAAECSAMNAGSRTFSFWELIGY